MIRRRRNHWPKLLAAAVLAVCLAAAYWTFKGKEAVAPSVEPSENSTPKASEDTDSGPTWKPAAGSLQTVVEDFAATHKGEYSVVILQPGTGTVLASYEEDDDNFAASLYKLWVAYEGYRKVDDGTYQLSDPYLNGWTREKCLDEMIRSSYSPCAEKMWAELGKTYLTQKASEYGSTSTDMTALRTNAHDVAQILSRIATGDGLSDTSREKYLDSMKTQEALYRRGLPSGFSESVTVYNKVGWNELVEWHDAAVVDFGNDKKLVIAVLTRGAGMANVAALSKAIEANIPN